MAVAIGPSGWRCGMDASEKRERLYDEFLIPVGFGWTIIIVALYVAVVVVS